MREKSLRTAILAGAVVVLLALPSSALAGQVVPPGNSAATQYTQVFPTSRGNVAVGTSIGDAGSAGKKKPAQVIGKKTTEELESHGSEGAAVAQLAAESAPEPTADRDSGEATSGGSGGGDKGAGGDRGAGKANGGAVAGNGGERAGSGGSGQSAGAGSEPTLVPVSADPGSSGVSEVLGQATGASSGPMGPFLPLVLLAALVLALVYAWRRRHHEPGTSP